jgi:hypothetical protein
MYTCIMVCHVCSTVYTSYIHVHVHTHTYMCTCTPHEASHTYIHTYYMLYNPVIIPHESHGNHQGGTTLNHAHI